MAIEKIGSLKVYDDKGKAHLFEVFRAHGYNVELDGTVILAGTTHSTALAFMGSEAERRGWTRRATA